MTTRRTIIDKMLEEEMGHRRFSSRPVPEPVTVEFGGWTDVIRFVVDVLRHEVRDCLAMEVRRLKRRWRRDR